MDKLKVVIERLRKLHKPSPIPRMLPSEIDVKEMEKLLGLSFVPDFKKYLLTGSDINFGFLEPVTITNPMLHTYLPEVISSARTYGLPESLFPFCEDNSDYYCLNQSSEIVFWSHNGPTDEKWSDLAEWIEKVWIEEGEE